MKEQTEGRSKSLGLRSLVVILVSLSHNIGTLCGDAASLFDEEVGLEET